MTFSFIPSPNRPANPEHPQFSWAYNGTRCGIAGRVLHALCTSNKGSLACGIRSATLNSVAARIMPSGVHRLTLTDGYSAFAFVDGSIILVKHIHLSTPVCYPWVLRYKGRLKTKPKGLEAVLETITKTLDFISGPFGMDTEDSLPLLPWVSLETSICSTFPNSIVKAVTLTSLERLLTTSPKQEFTLSIMGRLLACDTPKGVGPIDISWSSAKPSELREKFDMEGFKSSLSLFFNHDLCQWPLIKQIGQAHAKHSYNGNDWSTKPTKIFEKTLKLEDIHSLSAHERMEGHKICQTLNIPIM